jgi:hypothetical protein
MPDLTGLKWENVLKSDVKFLTFLVFWCFSILSIYTVSVFFPNPDCVFQISLFFYPD